jgi:hypothetical protein
MVEDGQAETRMALFPGPWGDLHAAKNDLTAAKLLLHCSRPGGGGIDVPQIEALIMEASSKIDELSFDGRRARPAAPAPMSEALRKVYQRQAELFEESAELLTAQAAMIAARIELASLLVQEKREEGALTACERDRQRIEREVLAFDREIRVLTRDIEVLQAHRERALAQAGTARQKIRMTGT